MFRVQIATTTILSVVSSIGYRRFSFDMMVMTTLPFPFLASSDFSYYSLRNKLDLWHAPARLIGSHHRRDGRFSYFSRQRFDKNLSFGWYRQVGLDGCIQIFY